jgi:hypothetical protein
MSTKTSLLSNINGFLSATITVLKHRNSMSAVVDEIYPTVLTDTHLGTTNVITKAGDNYAYSFRFSKQGRNISVSGSISNDSGSILSSGLVATITNTDFTASPSANVMCIAENGSILRLQFGGTNVNIFGVMPTNKTYYFNGIFTALN